MPPDLAAGDPTDKGGGNIESLCQFVAGYGRREATYLPHDLLGQFRVGMAASARGYSQPSGVGMADVLLAGYLLQVGQSVVILDAIDMVGLFTRGERAKESGDYQSMNPEWLVLMPLATTERDAKVTHFSMWLKNPARKGCAAFATRCESADAAKAGHFIPAFISNDGSPLFGFQGQGELCRIRTHRKPNPFGATQPDGPNHRGCLDYRTIGYSEQEPCALR